MYIIEIYNIEVEIYMCGWETFKVKKSKFYVINYYY